MRNCVYKISNTINERVYIGSAINFDKRKAEHIKSLRKGNHCNVKIQRFVNKYGIDCLFFEVIEICEKDTMINREQYYIDLYKCVKCGFNILPTAGSWLNRKHRESSKKKQSNAKKGIQSTGMLGKKHKDATKEKIRIKALGRKQSEETIKKRVLKNTGKRRPESAIGTVRKKLEILSRDQVLQIRVMLSNKIKQSEIAKIFGVCQGVISRVHTKKAYWDVY